MFFSNGTENKICVLFRDIFKCCLCPIKKSFATDASGAYRYFWLVYVVAEPLNIFNYAESDFYTILLVWLENTIENMIYRKHENHRG